MTLTSFFWILLGFYSVYLAVEITLDWLNLSYSALHKNHVPELFRNTFSDEDHLRSIAYTKDKTKVRIFSLVYHAVVLWTFAGLGWFSKIDALLQTNVSSQFLASLSYPFAVGFIFYCAGIPLAYYSQFVVENRFGFNKMTPKLFALDQVKSLFISLVLGLPLIALLLWLLETAGPSWWIWGFASFMLFQLLTTALFPVLIVPLFYKMVPLPEGELKESLDKLAEKVRFKTAGVFSIDGSKRSTHSNAFFAGMGKAKRIVLFDTLINNLTVPEITSVIAHEMGHNKKKHIQRSMLLSSIVILTAFWAMSVVISSPELYVTFGFAKPSMHAGIVLFAMFFSVFTFPLTPLFNLLSRKHEYEADAFSVETLDNKQNMISSLVKLSKDNLSNLNPHPLYSFFHYSHPTTLERARAIEKI